MIISSLIVAWILEQFEVARMILEVLQPHVGFELTNGYWYLAFLIIGVLLEFKR